MIPRSRLLDLAWLSQDQRQAVLAEDGPLLIVAGPGSGKTTVLAARIAYVIIARRIAPASVLALTFAARAAVDLRARLEHLLGDAAREVTVSTFHAFGLRVVRRWSEDLGFEPGPIAVCDAHDARSLLRETAAQIRFDLSGLSTRDLDEKVARARLRPDDASASCEIRELAAAYERCLVRRCAIDYPGMLVMPLRLFTARPDILCVLQDSYRCVVCDEFQDVCAPQYELLRQLTARHRHLAVVGDPCQAVFGWRGADARFLIDFAQDFPDARRIDLTQNYRSTGQIVDLANFLGSRLDFRPPLWTTNSAGPPVFLQVRADEQAEGAFVASEIRRLLDTGVVGDLGHVAVLARTNHQAIPLVSELRARGLPYRAQRGIGLQRSERFADGNQGPPAVLLTTIHGAKGGEWRVVFVVGVEEGLLPHHRALEADCRSGCGLDEELRLLYVAVTRAQERLYLSYCRTRQIGGRRETRHPSRFLRHLPASLVTQLAA